MGKVPTTNNTFKEPTIRYNIFDKDDNNTFITLTPYDFIMEDAVYVPDKVFKRLNIDKGDYLCFKIGD